MQSASSKVPAKSESSKGLESQKQASSVSAQKMTPGTQITSGSQKPQQTNQAARKQSSAATATQQESGGFFGFGGPRTESAKPEESVSGKMFGFGSSIFSSASTLITSAVQDESKTTPPVSPKMQPAKEGKPAGVQKPEQDRRPEAPQQTKAPMSGQVKGGKSPNKAVGPASQSAAKGGPSPCPICKTTLNLGSKDPPNYSTCTECKSSVCNQCGFNPMPNVKEVRVMSHEIPEGKFAALFSFPNTKVVQLINCALLHDSYTCDCSNLK